MADDIATEKQWNELHYHNSVEKLLDVKVELFCITAINSSDQDAISNKLTDLMEFIRSVAILNDSDCFLP